jgi:hypothetical protein
MPFPLLDLPPEIREKIYLHTLVSPTPIPLTADSPLLLFSDPLNSSNPNSSPNHQLHPLFPHALLLTCHQIYHEVRPLYFTHNTFSLLLLRDPSPLSYFISPTFQDNRRRIKVLKLVISRWGKHNFFLREFAPALEDMILNGSLRDLEVWARRLKLLLAGRDDGLIGGEGGVVERLVGILRDPYLERVVLKTPVEREQRQRRHQMDMREDVTSLIDAPLEDVTRLIGCWRGDHQRDYNGQVRKIPIL